MKEPSTEETVVAALIALRASAADLAIDDLRAILRQLDECTLIVLRSIAEATE